MMYTQISFTRPDRNGSQTPCPREQKTPRRFPPLGSSIRRAVRMAAVSALLAGGVALRAQANNGALTILGEGTVWRTFITCGPVLEWDGDAYQPVGRELELYDFSTGPHEGWAGVHFDDGTWARERLPLYAGLEEDGHGFQAERAVAMLALRGAFMIDQPGQAGDLSLRLRYRGGVVVHLNGEEIAREHLPEGELHPMTPAQPYPRDVYLTPDGGRIPPPRERGNDNAEINSRLDARIRSTAIRLPPDKLRRGRNVIALSFHRAPDPRGLPSYAGGRAHWSTLAPLNADLTAREGRGVEPNTGPPPQVQVWNADPLLAITPHTGHADPGAELRPLRMLAPRNGMASGQVVVSRAAGFGIDGVRAAVSPLRHVEGLGDLSAASVQVHYAHMPVLGDGRETGYFDIFQDHPQDDAVAQPVWVTVDVPEDAAPGEYRGMLRMATRFSPSVDVPVELTVAGWRAPDPEAYVSHLALMQSPDTVAERYGVPLYSEEHFTLLEPSLRLLGRARSQVMYVTAIRRTHFGNHHAMIQFREDEEGRITPDFTAFDRYLDLWAKHVGRPRIICLKVWGPGRTGDQVRLTKINARGEFVEWTHDDFGTGASKQLWEPVFQGLRQRIAARGWPEETLMLGVGADLRPSPQTVAFFQELAPEAKWALFTHGRGDPPPRDGVQVIRSMLVGYSTMPYIPRSRFPLGEHLIGGWNNPFLRTTSMRSPRVYDPPASWRVLPDSSVRGPYRGLARVGLDYWPLEGTASGERGTGLIARFGTNNVLDINLMRNNARSLTAPGTKGALHTVRLQMLMEGRQRTEARIAIEQALADDEKRGQLDDDLVERARALLNAHLAMLLLSEKDWNWLMTWNLRQHEQHVYETAAAIQSALGSD